MSNINILGYPTIREKIIVFLPLRYLYKFLFINKECNKCILTYQKFTKYRYHWKIINNFLIPKFREQCYFYFLLGKGEHVKMEIDMRNNSNPTIWLHFLKNEVCNCCPLIQIYRLDPYWEKYYNLNNIFFTDIDSFNLEKFLSFIPEVKKWEIQSPIKQNKLGDYLREIINDDFDLTIYKYEGNGMDLGKIVGEYA